MKYTVFSIFVFFVAHAAHAQGITSLHENFDVDCVLSTDFPASWLEANPLSHPVDSGLWVCTPTLGRPSLISGTPTPGIMCSGVYHNMYNLDTSYLVTPLLNLGGYSGNIYLQFDTRTTNIHLGGNLALLISTDTPYHDTATTIDLTASVNPLFGNGDSTGWVTHQANLTPYKNTPFYVVFRYTSTSSTGSAWYLDNVNTSTTRLETPVITGNEISLSGSGNSNSQDITIYFTAPAAGTYNLILYDLTGQLICNKIIHAATGYQTYSLDEVNLHSGIYFARLTNDAYSGIAKIWVR